MRLPQPGDGGKAVQPRQLRAQQGQMDRLLGQDIQHLPAGAGSDHLIALGGETGGQGGNDLLFVVADENTVHGKELLCVKIKRCGGFIPRRTICFQKGRTSCRSRLRRCAAETRCSMGFHWGLQKKAAKEMGM